MPTSMDAEEGPPSGKVSSVQIREMAGPASEVIVREVWPQLVFSRGIPGEVPELRFIQMERSAETLPMSELWPLLGHEEREGLVEMSEMQRT